MDDALQRVQMSDDWCLPPDAEEATKPKAVSSTANPSGSEHGDGKGGDGSDKVKPKAAQDFGDLDAALGEDGDDFDDGY